MAARQWQMKLGAPGVRVTGVEELEQSLAICLTTPLGSVAGNPTFGSKLHEYADEPLGRVRAMAPAEAKRAVRESDPRLEVIETNVLPGDEPGVFELEVYWKPAGTDAAARMTEVPVR